MFSCAMNKELPQASESEILLYTSPDGEVQLDIRMKDETLWMPQQMMAELFQTTAPG